MTLRRGQVYCLLSELFLDPPSGALVRRLRNEGTLEDLGRLLEIPASTFFQDGRNPEEEYEGLVQDYHDLFIVPLDRYLTPYESVYRDERGIDGVQAKGLLVGRSTQEVLRFYRRAGAEVADDFPDLPDHAGLELAFMGFLCQEEGEAREKGEPSETLRILGLQQAFLKDHVDQWMPNLCDCMFQNAQTAFYKALARLTRAFISFEQETLKQIVAE